MGHLPWALGYDAAMMDGWSAPAPPFGRVGRLLALCTLLACAQPLPASACGHPPSVREATSAQIGTWLRERDLKVLSFVGYSGAGYEDPNAMLAAASQVLARHDPARTVVNIGATRAGIGAVYELARQRGFETMGIVSTLARDAGEPLSPCVDQVFFVRDAQWGGNLPGSTRLSPTSAAIVAHSQEIVAIGGGDIARDELRGARAAGVPVSFIAADMNHALARDKARSKGQPAPTDFGGTAGDAFHTIR